MDPFPADIHRSSLMAFYRVRVNQNNLIMSVYKVCINSLTVNSKHYIKWKWFSTVGCFCDTSSWGKTFRVFICSASWDPKLLVHKIYVWYLMSADVLERTYGLKWKIYMLKIIYNLKEWKLWFIKKCMYECIHKNELFGSVLC